MTAGASVWSLDEPAERVACSWICWFVAVFGMELTIGPGDGLRRFVRLEPFVERALSRRARRVSEPLIAEHQIVVGLQVFRIDGQHTVERDDRFLVLALQEQHATELIQDDAITRILRVGDSQVIDRFIVASETLQCRGEENASRQFGVNLQRPRSTSSAPAMPFPTLARPVDQPSAYDGSSGSPWNVASAFLISPCSSRPIP